MIGGRSHNLAVDDTVLCDVYVPLEAPEALSEPTLMFGKSCAYGMWTDDVLIVVDSRKC